jgi:activator of Hsp90 ATPase-like protein
MIRHDEVLTHTSPSLHSPPFYKVPYILPSSVCSNSFVFTLFTKLPGCIHFLPNSELATHSPGKVWQALTDPAHLREWAPFEVDGSLGMAGTVKLTWVGMPTPLETRVTRADAPKVLEYNDTRWELEAFGGGTRLTLWHNIDRRFISSGAAGWRIAFDVLDRLLSGTPIGPSLAVTR